jgi:uncharacterized RDD family membrane protein YckC
MLDTTLRAETPEGVELDMRPAGPVPRALAWLIDLLWRVAALLVIGMTFGYFGAFGNGVFLLSWFVLEWLVPACFEAWWDGATPGKRAVGIRVIADSGAPVGWNAALSRNLLRFADFLPAFYFGGLLTMVCNPRFQRLGDLVAGTLVVHVDPAPAPRRIAPAAPRAPRRLLSPEEARTVIDLAERSTELGRERTEELLALAQPLLGSNEDEAGLRAIAHHLIGSPEAGRAPG